MKYQTIQPTILLAAVAVTGWTVSAGEADWKVDRTKIPPAADRQVEFVRDIKPLFERSCVKCHGGRRPKNGYNMETREGMIKGGRNDRRAIIVGQSESSPVVQAASDAVEDEDQRMPPVDRRDDYPKLTAQQIGLVRAWIDQGAKWPEGVELKPAE